MTTKASQVALAIIWVLAVSCGSAQISEDSMRKSERFYEAAYIAWHEQGDNLAAIRHLTRSVETDPGNDDAHYLLGTIRLGREEYDEAETHLKMAVKLRDSNPMKKVEAQNSLAVLYINTERYAEAIVLLEEASKEVLNRAPWLAFGNLGLAYMKQGDYDKAEKALKRALFDQPMFCLGLFRLGNVYYLQERYKEAAAKLSESVSIQEGGCDKLQEAHHLLGLTLLRQNQIDDAVLSLEACVEINPTSQIGMDCASVREGL